MQPISRTISSCKTESLHSLNNNSPFLPPPRHPIPGNHYSTFCFYEFDTSYKWRYKYLSFCDWLISLGVMSSRFIPKEKKKKERKEKEKVQKGIRNTHFIPVLPRVRPTTNLPLSVRSNYLSVFHKIYIYISQDTHTQRSSRTDWFFGVLEAFN